MLARGKAEVAEADLCRRILCDGWYAAATVFQAVAKGEDRTGLRDDRGGVGGGLA